MIQELAQKIVLLTPPAAIVDNAALTVAALDTKGWGFMSCYLILGATDIAVATCKMTYSDDNSSYSDVANGNFATGTLPSGSASAVPSATDDNKVFGWHGKPKKRYYKPAVTGGDGTAGAYLMIIAILSRPMEAPNSTSERGLDEELFI